LTIERAGAAALILGTVAMIAIMLLHPVSHGAVSAPEATAMMRMGLIVHAAAIATAPLLTFGFFAFTRNIGLDTPLATLALAFYAFGAVTVMLAAAMSGLVAPRLLAWRLESPADQALIHGLARLEWFLNQSFAQIHVAFFSIAVALWAVSWPGRGVLAVILQVTGIVVGIGVLVWLLSGTLELNVHGMGAVVLAQGAWTLLAAVALLAREKRPARSD
jgi:hypothetical protein